MDGAVGQGIDDLGLDAHLDQHGQDAVADPSQIGAVAQVRRGGGHPAGGGTHQELRGAAMDVAQELIGVEGVRRQAAASSYPVHPESTARHTEEPICRDAFRTS